ncbi:MAG: nitrate reductase cytochrome c-type subunit [Mariprofundales bacterium]|nr:nitrate reductase cytochrome c-type subunit [Mariprofundales bacterium]
MRQLKLFIAAFLAGFLLLSSSLAWADGDRVLSLRGEPTLSAGSVPTTAKSWSVDGGKINREYIQQPPLIPHDIEGFTIDKQGNACLNCHNWRSEMPGATKVAISHFLTRGNHSLANISPRRYFCTQCHVPQRDAKPLVANMFKSLVVE